MGKEGYLVRMEVKRGWAVAEMKVGRHQKRSSENVQTTFLYVWILGKRDALPILFFIVRGFRQTGIARLNSL